MKLLDGDNSQMVDNEGNKLRTNYRVIYDFIVAEGYISVRFMWRQN